MLYLLKEIIFYVVKVHNSYSIAVHTRQTFIMSKKLFELALREAV